MKSKAFPSFITFAHHKYSAAFSLALVALFLPLTFAADTTSKPTTRPRARPALDPSLIDVQDVPKLPRVLLIGDSISMGYTLPVREKLVGKANVHRPTENCADTANGLKSLDKWLGDSKWDVIHFNFGLHDLKYLDANGKYVNPPDGKQVATLDQDEANLRQLVDRLNKTGATLIWASTTPVPDGTLGRAKDDELKYNEVAKKVMDENHIAIDDLHEVVTASPKLQLRKNVHFSKEGYEMLADSVAKSIESVMAARSQNPQP
jgi:acyl-CoA thioesterase-1